jgi:putative FmdB family regulatory protein
MPIYEYICEDCGHVTEALRAMRDADTAYACEKCESTRTRRAHSVPAAAPSAEGGGEAAFDPASCPTCGDPGGSCAM